MPPSVGAIALVAMLTGGGPPAAAAESTIGTDGYVHVSPMGTVLGADPYYPKDGNGGYDVGDYNLAIEYLPSSTSIRAKATITATATQDLSRFNLDLCGLSVYSVKVDGVGATHARVGDHELVVTPRTMLAAGAAFTVEIVYGGSPRPLGTARGLVGWQRGYESAVAVGMPRSAMTWFPVNNTEVDKATLHVALTVPNGWQAVSNGTRVSDTPISGYRHTVTWAEETAVAPSAVMAAMGRRWQVDTATLPDGRSVYNAYATWALDKRALGNKLPEVIEFLSGVLGDYPQSAAGGMFLDRPATTHPAQTRPVYGVYAGMSDLVYATAYQWWGDGVTTKMWKDTQLTESFARYAVWLWDAEKNGVDLDQRYLDQVTAAKADARFWAPKLTDPGARAEYTPTAKGVLMVHALRKTVGDELFFQMYSGFPAINQQSNQGWYDFGLYAEAVAERDLSGFFGAWWNGTVIPADEFLFPGEGR
ncbi:putative metallopeptidase [Alloactinosynnema sp. L-07]|nr:putative metallopeptidase [Alloactinosynnema sp. L-07]